MTPENTMTNLAASIRQRLMNWSRQHNSDFNLALVRFGIERLLYRLSRSPHAQSFLLKGSMLFLVWESEMPRPTRDVDLLAFGDAAVEKIKSQFEEILQLPVEADGLVFDKETLQVEAIRETAVYSGLRVSLQANLGNARIPVQIDIGFGDVVFPQPEKINFPTLLDLPAPKLRAYPIYTVIAEKLHAIALLGEANSRMKDFFDLWYIQSHFSIDNQLLTEAISLTFQRRKMQIKQEMFSFLGVDFILLKQNQWRTFLSKNGLAEISFTCVLEAIKILVKLGFRF
jgi:predicted nucleotidyltransferase component of viral defense system